jgi:thermostable 8-oxoguanine DNA glycosylase
MKVTVNDEKALILDRKIISIIRLDRFEELHSLKGIKYQNAIDHYVEYLTIVKKIANQMEVEPRQIELFLFMFGQNLTDDLQIGNKYLNKF